MQNITILGSTGSVGVNTLDVIALHPNRFSVFALSANNNNELLLEQCIRFKPRYAVLLNEAAATQLQSQLRNAAVPTEVLCGVEALQTIASHPSVNTVMAAIVGAAGLLPSLAAAKAGKRVLLANKEALVMAGNLFIEAVQQNDAVLLPIDSEHNAIFQCLPAGFRPGQRPCGIRRLILTASGGPFRTTATEKLALVTPEQACAHPVWQMGQKISVDSATMMNKGLEIIEACYLFGMPLVDVQVLLHPQSVVHSLVEYDDGSVLAQLGNPDMRTPIAHALAWPDRIAAGVAFLDLIKVGKLDFEELNLTRYPCVALAHAAVLAGGTATTILNAANEVAVQAFLNKDLPFMAIPKLIERVMGRVTVRPATSISIILEDDAESREVAYGCLNDMRAAI